MTDRTACPIFKPMSNAIETYEAAAAAVRDGESRGLGRTAMAKRYRALFAAEDALKGRDSWR